MSSPESNATAPWLVCFAVKEESKFFQPAPGLRTLLTGMGRRNAFRALEKEFAAARPAGVLTCGFAGGLNPKFELAAIAYDMDEESPWEKALLKSNGTLARFYCAARVAITADEKYKLWRSTGLDVVEMESETIRDFCRKQSVPSATIRVVSDTAHQNLPLDFNRLLTPDHRVDCAKLAARLILSPRKIAELLRFQSQTIAAAQSLGAFLARVIADSRTPAGI